jgi:hypothetical protein
VDLGDTFVPELDNVRSGEVGLDVIWRIDELLLAFWEEVGVATFVEDEVVVPVILVLVII